VSVASIPLQYLLNLRQVPFIFVGVRVSLAGDQLANAMIGSGLPPHPFRHIIQPNPGHKGLSPGIELLPHFCASCLRKLTTRGCEIRSSSATYPPTKRQPQDRIPMELDHT
jgi:hypothetical protein